MAKIHVAAVKEAISISSIEVQTGGRTLEDDQELLMQSHNEGRAKSYANENLEIKGDSEENKEKQTHEPHCLQDVPSTDNCLRDSTFTSQIQEDNPGAFLLITSLMYLSSLLIY